jgi:hypothetical protein
MPRDGANIYSRPAGTDGVPDATILSAAYNVYVADVEQDLNAPRPVVAGGTGGTSPITARTKLGAEVSSLSQIVTNYDAQVWESGSFLSFVGATAAPTAPDNYAGVCVLMTGDQQNIYLHATNFTTGEIYVRRKNSGVWTSWILGADASKLSVHGGIIDGNLTVNGTSALNILNVYGLTSSSGIVNNGNLTVTGTLSVSGITTCGGINAYGPVDIESGILTLGGGMICNAGAVFHDTTIFTGAVQLPGGISGNVAVAGTLSATVELFSSGEIVAAGLTRTHGGLLCDAHAAFSNIEISVTGPNVISVAHGVSYYGALFQSDVPNSYPLGFNNTVGALVGSIQASNTGTAYNTTCDARRKDDMQPLHIAGDVIDRTRVYDFHWKGTEERGHGVLAQEAAEVYPHAFTHDTISDCWGVDYSKYVPLLIAELQALRARVKQLESTKS